MKYYCTYCLTEIKNPKILRWMDATTFEYVVGFRYRCTYCMIMSVKEIIRKDGFEIQWKQIAI